MRYASPILAIVLTLLGGLVLFTALGRNPIEAFRVYFVSPLKDAYGISELFLRATPLMLIAAGLAIGFRANVWNIGAEGQFIVGAIAGTGVGLATHDIDRWWVLPLMLVAGAIGGAAFACIPAILRIRLKVS